MSPALNTTARRINVDAPGISLSPYVINEGLSNRSFGSRYGIEMQGLVSGAVVDRYGRERLRLQASLEHGQAKFIRIRLYETENKTPGD